MNWVPVDAIAKAYTELVLSENGKLPQLVNFVHPRDTAWEVILRGVKNAVDVDLPLVPVKTWIDKLRALSAAASAETLLEVVSQWSSLQRFFEEFNFNQPALQLLAFFSEMIPGDERAGFGSGAVKFETSALEDACPTMRTLQSTAEDDVASWIKYWRSIEYIR